MDEVRVYWKDLKVGVRKKLLLWYKKHKFEKLEPLFNNELPFITISKDLYTDDELPEIDHSGEMVS